MDGGPLAKKATGRSPGASRERPAPMYPHHARSLAGSSPGEVASVQTQWGIQKTDAGTVSQLREVLKKWLIMSTAASSPNIHNRLGQHASALTTNRISEQN